MPNVYDCACVVRNLPVQWDVAGDSTGSKDTQNEKEADKGKKIDKQ